MKVSRNFSEQSLLLAIVLLPPSCAINQKCLSSTRCEWINGFFLVPLGILGLPRKSSILKILTLFSDILTFFALEKSLLFCKVSHFFYAPSLVYIHFWPEILKKIDFS